MNYITKKLLACSPSPSISRQWPEVYYSLFYLKVKTDSPHASYTNRQTSYIHYKINDIYCYTYYICVPPRKFL